MTGTRAGATALLLALLLAPLLAGTASADYQVRGRFLYTDREFGPGGFTGAEPNRPIREADVQVIDAVTTLVLGTGVTDANGEFTIQVTDNLVRNVIVRALASSYYTADLHVRVVNNVNAVFAVAHPTFNAHSPTMNIDFRSSPVIAAPSTPGNARPGDAFNIYDVALDGLNFIGTQLGARPGVEHDLSIRWYLGNGECSCYSPGAVRITLFGLSVDSDSYDDSIILHELGHYVEYRWSASSSPGGGHQLDQCYVLPLAWSEGWATFFQNMVRNWLGLSRPDIYVDTSGQPGPGNAFISYSVETVGFALEAGSGNEVSVNAALWDIVDTPQTLDATIGADDDGLNLADAVARCWDVHTNYMSSVGNVQVEKFWDGWFAGGNGQAAAMQAAFSVYSMRFYDDATEPDDTAQTARFGGIINGSTQHTLYAAGDQDWTRFDGVNGGTYNFTLTTPLDCGVATSMVLYDSNATTILRTHATSINWTAVKNGPLYLRVTRPAPDTYGHYELTVDISVPVTLTDVRWSTTPDGVTLTWHAVEEGAFSHFHVQRSQHPDGPYEFRSTTPLQDAPQGEYTFTDTGTEPGRSYWYRIVGYEESGEAEWFGPYEVAIAAAAPAALRLHPARPNPFNPNTVLSFDLPQQAAVFVRIYAVDGRLVRSLLTGETLAAGTRQVAWDGRDDQGAPSASGVYLVRLEAAGRSDTQRAVLVR